MVWSVLCSHFHHCKIPISNSITKAHRFSNTNTPRKQQYSNFKIQIILFNPSSPLLLSKNTSSPPTIPNAIVTDYRFDVKYDYRFAEKYLQCLCLIYPCTRKVFNHSLLSIHYKSNMRFDRVVPSLPVRANKFPITQVRFTWDVYLIKLKLLSFCQKMSLKTSSILFWTRLYFHLLLKLYQVNLFHVTITSLHTHGHQTQVNTLYCA